MPNDERRQRPFAHYKDAIGDYFVEFPRWLDIRPLWARGDMQYFRVNFWKTDQASNEQRIARSVFLAIEDCFDGLRVQEIQ